MVTSSCALVPAKAVTHTLFQASAAALIGLRETPNSINAMERLLPAPPWTLGIGVATSL